MIQTFTTWFGFTGPIGGAKPPAKRSSAWPKVRAAHLAAHPRCAVCGRAKNVVPHHVLPYHLFPLLELEPNNLVTLCEGDTVNCHLLVGHGMLWSKYNPDVRGDAVRIQRLIATRLG